MMSGPDPYGTGLYYDTVYSDQYLYPNYGDEGPSWWDLAQQAIREGAQTAQIIGAGYPPGSTVVYAPQYPGGPIVPTVQAPPPSPYPMPMPGQTVPTSAPGGGVQLSNTTLMLLVGGALLFMLGGKRGR